MRHRERDGRDKDERKNESRQSDDRGGGFKQTNTLPFALIAARDTSCSIFRSFAHYRALRLSIVASKSDPRALPPASRQRKRGGREEKGRQAEEGRDDIDVLHQVRSPTRDGWDTEQGTAEAKGSARKAEGEGGNGRSRSTSPAQTRAQRRKVTTKPWNVGKGSTAASGST